MYLPADQQIRSLPTRTRIQPSASSCPVPRVVESRFKKWLKQQGGAAAGKQAVGAAAAEDDVESGSEDDAPQPEGKASASNDTKKIAGHFPGWPVGSRWVAPPFSAEVHAAVPPERSAPRLVPPACHSTRKPNNCRASASTSLPAHPSARPPAHLPLACPAFLPAHLPACLPAHLPARRNDPCRAYSRAELACLGFHFPPIAGIDFVQTGKAGRNAPSVRAKSASTAAWTLRTA